MSSSGTNTVRSETSKRRPSFGTTNMFSTWSLDKLVSLRATVPAHQSTPSNTVKTRFTQIFRIRHSVILSIIMPVLFMTGWGALIWYLYEYVNKNVAVSNALITILAIVVGLLLVFRTNTAYDRFWEGRKLWSTLVNHTRNLARYVWITVPSTNENELKEKKAALNLLLAFAVSIKHYLRSEYGPNYSDLLPLIRHLPEFSGKEIDLPPFDNMPLELTYHISSFVAKKKAQDKIDVSTTTVMTNAISGMVDCLSQFERILRTPIPAAYSIHLKQTLVIYCLALPFQLVQSLGVAIVPIMCIASFTLFGIEAIGAEIENPFGYDSNDLPQDEYCAIIQAELNNVMIRPTKLDPQDWKLENLYDGSKMEDLAEMLLEKKEKELTDSKSELTLDEIVFTK